MNQREYGQKGGLINMAAFLARSEVNGPGVRAVVWVQGCMRRCAGCFNQDMQEFRDNEIVSVEQLAERILAIQGLEGVSFSGGEPFAQALPLAQLAETLTRQGLNIVIFTGYTYTELKAGNDPAWNRLLAAADMLVAGPFVQELPAQKYLLASANQELILLTDRLKTHPAIGNHPETTVEVTIDTTGNVSITGLTNKIGGLI